MINYIQEYYSKIDSGEIIAGKRIKQVYKKLAEELDHPVDNWIFDIEKANQRSNLLKHTVKIVRVNGWENLSIFYYGRKHFFKPFMAS